MIFKLDDKHNGGILPFELAQKEIIKHPLAAKFEPKIENTSRSCEPTVSSRRPKATSMPAHRRNSRESVRKTRITVSASKWTQCVSTSF